MSAIDIDLPADAGERWNDGTSSILRRLLHEHAERAVLALARFHGLPAAAKEEDDAHNGADSARDALASAFAAYVAKGHDPVATILARCTGPRRLHLAAWVVAERATAAELCDRLVAAGLRPTGEPAQADALARTVVERSAAVEHARQILLNLLEECPTGRDVTMAIEPWTKAVNAVDPSALQADVEIALDALVREGVMAFIPAAAIHLIGGARVTIDGWYPTGLGEPEEDDEASPGSGAP